jgi:hypothetical protein
MNEQRQRFHSGDSVRLDSGQQVRIQVLSNGVVRPHAPPGPVPDESIEYGTWSLRLAEPRAYPQPPQVWLTVWQGPTSYQEWNWTKKLLALELPEVCDFLRRGLSEMPLLLPLPGWEVDIEPDLAVWLALFGFHAYSAHDDAWWKHIQDCYVKGEFLTP